MILSESPLGLAEALDAEVVEARDRGAVGLAGRDLAVTAVMAALFLVAAAALAVAAPSLDVSIWIGALLVVTYAGVSRIEFEIGSGSLVPTQLVLVPMLFILPPGMVPLAVALALLLGSSPEFARGRLHPSRALVSLVYSSHALGPAAVLVAAGIQEPAWSDWPVLLLALFAGFAFDIISALAREVGGVGVDAKVVLAGMAHVYLMDALLAPIGFLAALAAVEAPAAALAVVPLAVLFRFFALERRVRIDRAVELSDAVVEVGRTARMDALTGVANRLAWEEELVRSAGLQSIGVVIADVDGLKTVNDTYGHDLGDELIRSVAQTLHAIIGSDVRLLARLGGDEFGCLVDGVDVNGLDQLVVELSAAFASIPPLRHGVPVSASVGCFSMPPALSLAAAIEEADRRVNRDKAKRGVSRGSAVTSSEGPAQAAI